MNQIRVGSRPGPITASADAIWVANVDDQTLYRIDPHTLSTRPIALQATPTDLAYGTGEVWVANGLLGTLERVDTEFNTARDPIQTGAGPAVGGSIAIGFDSVWFASANSVVKRLDPNSGNVTGTRYSGESPSRIAIGSNAIWVANKAGRNIYKFSPRTSEPMILPSICNRPTAIATGGDAVWVACDDSNTVIRIDPPTEVTTPITVGNHPSAITYGARSVWVTNAGDGTVSRLDPATNKVTKTITVGNDPEGIVVAENRVWVAVQAR